MSSKHRIPALPSFEVFLTALLLALIFAWPVKDALFLFISGGTPLSIRSPLVQSAYLAGLLGAAALFFLLVCQKPIAWLLAHAYLAFFALPLVPLAAHACIGSFSRFVADDFSSATLAVNKGILGATWDWYVNWSGRFAASFFDSLFGYLGPSSLRSVTGLTLLLLLAGLTALAWQIFPSRAAAFRLGLSVFLPALVLAASFGLTPDLPQSLYWGQGMRSLIFPLIPAAFLAAYLFYLQRRAPAHSSFLRLAMIGLVSFLAGGFGETSVVIQITLFTLTVMLVCLTHPVGWKSKPILLPLLAGWLASLAAMLVIIAAPGNQIRQSYFPPPPHFFDLLAISARSLFVFLQSMLSSFTRVLTLAGVFLAAVSAGYLYAKQENLSTRPLSYPDNFLLRGFARTSGLLLGLAALLLYASFVPAAYGMSTLPPERTWIIPVLLLCAYLAGFGVLLGIHLRAERGVSPDIPRLKPRLAGWLLFFLLAFCTYQATASILAVRGDYQRFADVFDRADRLIREAKARGETAVQVPEVHNHFGLSDYGAGTTYWLDQAVDTYYGIHVIVNKNMK